MTSELFVPRERRPLTPGATYVIGVAVLTMLAIALAQAGLDLGGLLVVVSAVLGPLGVLGGFMLVVLSSTGAVVSDPILTGEAGVAFDLGLLAAVIAIAATNVLLVARSVARSGERVPPGRYWSRIPVVADRLLGRWAFVAAAALFVGLCVVAGYSALLAGGVDVVEPAAKAAATLTAAAIAWLPAAAAAIGGLVLWVVNRAPGRAVLRWALADLAIQTVALSGLILFLTTSDLAAGDW